MGEYSGHPIISFVIPVFSPSRGLIISKYFKIILKKKIIISKYYQSILTYWRGNNIKVFQSNIKIFKKNQNNIKAFSPSGRQRALTDDELPIGVDAAHIVGVDVVAPFLVIRAQELHAGVVVR